jgi:hypothetical protein
MQCQGPGCTKHVQQKHGGHRARKYCSDACRVAAHRAAARAEEAERVNDDVRRAAAEKEAETARERQEIRTRYTMLSDASIDLLLYAKQQYGLHAVSTIGAALVHEQETSGEDRARYADLQEANRQNSKRIAHLGIELQRYQRLEVLKSRDLMLAELMLLGGRLNYASMTDLGIGASIDEWLNYVRGASDGDLAAAIAHGFYQADRLAMAAIEASDLQRERQMRDRTDELERLVALQAGRIDELEHGAGENVEEADELSQEQVTALRYHARERTLLLEQQARQIEEMDGTVRARIDEIHRLKDSHGRTMYQMNLLLAEAQSAAQRVQGETEPTSSLLDNEQQRAALAQLLLALGKEQKYPALHLSGYLRLFAGQFTEDALFDINEGQSAWKRAMAKLSIPALLVALVSMQARRALEEQRSIASEHAWREHLSLEEARKEASEFAGKYYRLKEQLEQGTSASIATNGERSADAEKIRVAQELESLRTLIAKQEQALAVRSDTVIKRGATIRAQEQAIQEQKNQLAKVADELDMAEEKIQRLSNQLERVQHLLEAGQEANQEKSGQNKQQAAIERARDEIRALYQVSITVAEENRDNALKQVAELSRQLEKAQRGAEEVSGQEKPLEWMSEPSYIVLQTWRSRPELTEEQLEWIKWQAIKDTSVHLGLRRAHTEAEGEHYRQALQAYFAYANVPAEKAEAHIPPSLKAASIDSPVREEI